MVLGPLRAEGMRHPPPSHSPHERVSAAPVMQHTPNAAQVAMVGSGAWACTAVRMVAQSTAEAAVLPGSVFEPEVSMWVHEGASRV